MMYVMFREKHVAVGGDHDVVLQIQFQIESRIGMETMLMVKLLYDDVGKML